MISCRPYVAKCLLPQIACRMTPQFVHGQPCCSSQTGPLVALPIPHILGAGLSTLSLRLFSASSGGGDKSHDRPHMYQLEHIQKRLEFTVPLMFKTRLDYTFYTKNVSLDNQILGSQINGLDSLMNHISLVSVAGHIFCTHIETRIISISPILEDGTVRLRWRICYIGWLGLLNLRNFNIQYRQKNLKWYDGYSIFYVNGEGLVYKVTIQKTMPDDSLTIASMKERTKQFVQRVLPSPSTSCMGQQQFAATKCVDSSRPSPQERGEGQRQNETKKWTNGATMRLT